MRYILLAVVAIATATWLALAGPPGGHVAADPEPSPPPAAPPAGGAVVAEPSREDPDAGARAALLTIYARVYASVPREGAPPITHAEIEALDVVAAAKVLAANALEGRDTRRRRAAAVLAAAAKPLDPRGARWTPAAFGEALEILKAPREAIAAKLGVSGADPPYPEQIQVRREEMVYQVLDAEGGDLGPLCCACLQAFDIDQPVGGRPGMAFFQLEVQRPLDEIKQAMDPQRWASCNPEFFAASHVTADDSCTTGETTPLDDPATPGTEWNGMLFEAFRVGLPLDYTCTLFFDNLLRIGAHWNSATSVHRIDYGICRSLGGGFSCAPSPDHGIKVDCGYAAARAASTGGSVVSGAKFLEFTDPVLNGSMYVGLKAMLDEIRSRGVCCEAAVPDGCPACLSNVPLLEDIEPEAPSCDEGAS